MGRIWMRQQPLITKLNFAIQCWIERQGMQDNEQQFSKVNIIEWNVKPVNFQNNPIVLYDTKRMKRNNQIGSI